MNKLDSELLIQLLAGQRTGRSLNREFYLEPALWEAEVDRVLWNKWHLVGHVSQLPEPGDYQLIDMLGESVIILRDQEASIRAFFNVCRHRGSR